MKYYNTPYQEVMDMPVHRFFLLIDEIKELEPDPDKITDTKYKGKPKPIASKDDFMSFF